MAHSVLLFVPMPNETDAMACRLWRDLPSIVGNIAKQYKGILQIGRETMLIDIDNHLPALVALVAALDNVPYRYAILDEEVSWHEEVNKLRFSLSNYTSFS